MRHPMETIFEMIHSGLRSNLLAEAGRRKFHTAMLKASVGEMRCEGVLESKV